MNKLLSDEHLINLEERIEYLTTLCSICDTDIDPKYMNASLNEIILLSAEIKLLKRYLRS
jgi:hypothetical protein